MLAARAWRVRGDETSARVSCGDDRIGIGQAHLAAFDVHQPHGRRARRTLPEPREEGGVAPKVLLRPVVKWMIVTPGAIEADAEKDPRRGRAQRMGLDAQRRVEQGRSALVATGGHEQVGHDPIVSPTQNKLSPQPILQSDQPSRLRWIELPRQHQVAPHVGQVRGVGRGIEQTIDQRGPLVGVVVVEECLRFGNRRNHAGQIERQPAVEFGVIGRCRGFDANCLPAPCQKLVDALRDRSVVIDRGRLGCSGPLACAERHGESADTQVQPRAEPCLPG